MTTQGLKIAVAQESRKQDVPVYTWVKHKKSDRVRVRVSIHKLRNLSALGLIHDRSKQ